MSYADAVKKSGPVGAEPVPPVNSADSFSNPAHIETSSTDNVVVPEEDLKEFKQSSEDKVKSKAKEFSKEAEHLKKEGNDLFKSLFESLKKGFAQASDSIHKVGLKSSETGKSLVKKSSEELKNPVVLIQGLVLVSGFAGCYFAYLERNRIDTNNKWTLGIHGALLTAFAAVDGYLFNKYYPKYK